MKLLTKTFPLLLIKIGCAQTAVDNTVTKIDYGYSFSTFSGIALNNLFKEHSITSGELIKANLHKAESVPLLNYGWKQGVFLWINQSPCFAFKPELNVTFCVHHNKSLVSGKRNEMIYSTAVGLEFKPQLIIRIGCRNIEPIIKLARNMSYYLTQRQSYFIIAPKFSYQKSDRAFLKNNVEKNYSFGIVFGGGTDNLFPNLDVAPEITMSIEYLTGNNQVQKKGSNSYYTSLSLSMNFF